MKTARIRGFRKEMETLLPFAKMKIAVAIKKVQVHASVLKSFIMSSWASKQCLKLLGFRCLDEM